MRLSPHRPSIEAWLHARILICLQAMALLFGTLSVGAAQAQATPPAAVGSAMQLRIVGGLATINQYTRNEEPFWTQELLRLSGGKYGAEIVPFDRAGVPGSDMLRLLKLGVMPFGTALLSFLEPQYPQYAAADLAGLNPDMATLKKNVAAFRPYLEKELLTRHNIQLLAIYVYPAQVVFCKSPFARLTDLKGRRVRVSTASQADFVSALGAMPVMTGFAQIIANFESGNIDCAVTGTMSGNTLGLQQLTSHVSSLPLTWGPAVFAANKDAWNALPPDLRALLSRELPRLEASIWAQSERETAEGLACNTGVAGCRNGRSGHMQQVSPNAQDTLLQQQIFTHTVLPRWLARCGPACPEVWRQTIGVSSGIQAKATP